MYRSRIRDVDPLKSSLIEEGNETAQCRFTLDISTRCSSTKRSGSGVHVFKLVFEHMDGGHFEHDFSYVCFYTGTH